MLPVATQRPVQTSRDQTRRPDGRQMTGEAMKYADKTQQGHQEDPAPFGAEGSREKGARRGATTEPTLIWGWGRGMGDPEAS